MLIGSGTNANIIRPHIFESFEYNLGIVHVEECDTHVVILR